MSEFGSLPQPVGSSVERCGATYTELDSREGSFPAKCSRPKGHEGHHGWGSPSEMRYAESRKEGGGTWAGPQT